MLLLWPALVPAQPLLLVDAVPDAGAPWLTALPARYTVWLETHRVAQFLQLAAPVFATTLTPRNPLRLHLVAAPTGESLRARTLGDDVAVQVREQDSPDRRADVIVHEAVHALQQRSRVSERVVGLPPEARELLDEALATAIGQGVWRRLDHAVGEAVGEIAWRRGRDRTAEDLARPWYVAERKGQQVDAWARALTPTMTRALAHATPLPELSAALLATWQAGKAHTLGGKAP